MKPHIPHTRWIPVLVVFLAIGAPGQGNAFEPWRAKKPARSLTDALRESSQHRVGGDIHVEGYQHNYRVESPHGRFDAQGTAMLRRLIRELHALSTMGEITRTEAFTKAAGEVLASPFEALWGLATNPVATVTGIPKGVGRLFEAVGETLEGGDSDYEDNEAEALLTLSKFKRRYAAELGIDVYSTNPKVQEELNRIGWAAAIGNLAPSVLTMPISGPAIVVAKALDWTDTLNDLLVEESPSTLRHDNEIRLEKMGADPELASRFVDHPLFSPRHTTVIVHALGTLDGVAGRDHLLQIALGAKNEVQALFHQQLAEMLAGVHREQPLGALHRFRNLVVARTKAGGLIAAVPIDEGRWTRAAARALRQLAAKPPGEGEPETMELWVSGTASDALRKEIKSLGITLQEDGATRLGLLD